MRCKRVTDKHEPLYDLVTGHVAVELIKEHVPAPVINSEVFQKSIAGEEVVMVDPEKHSKLKSVQLAHGNKGHYPRKIVAKSRKLPLF